MASGEDRKPQHVPFRSLTADSRCQPLPLLEVPLLPGAASPADAGDASVGCRRRCISSSGSRQFTVNQICRSKVHFLLQRNNFYFLFLFMPRSRVSRQVDDSTHSTDSTPHSEYGLVDLVLVSISYPRDWGLFLFLLSPLVAHRSDQALQRERETSRTHPPLHITVRSTSTTTTSTLLGRGRHNATVHASTSLLPASASAHRHRTAHWTHSEWPRSEHRDPYLLESMAPPDGPKLTFISASEVSGTLVWVM